MCLAIYKPEDKVIPEFHLENGFSNNPDGAGFAAFHKGSLRIRRGYFDIETFLREFHKYRADRAIVHFRWATSGGIGKQTCHPLPLPGGGAMIHNGVFQDAPSGEHDTAWYIREYLRHLPSSWYLSPVYRDLVGSHIGSGNKLAILGPDGRAGIVNAHRGLWDGGIWYSNTGYKSVEWSRSLLSGDEWERWYEQQDDTVSFLGKELHEMTDLEFNEFSKLMEGKTDD